MGSLVARELPLGVKGLDCDWGSFGGVPTPARTNPLQRPLKPGAIGGTGMMPTGPGPADQKIRVVLPS
jgi:hypothetical protein